MPKTFPYLEVSGTHQEVGYAIGRGVADKIQNRIQWLRENTPDYESFRGSINPFLKEAQNTFPALVEELRGISEGSGVAFDDLFLANSSEVIDMVKHQKEKAAHCTIAVSFGKFGAVVGHNEDWPAVLGSIDQLYTLRATIGGTTFVGLHYAGELPGGAAAMNNWGLVQCINSLYADYQIGVPKSFLARAVLESRSLDEAEQLVRHVKRASGYNHVLIQGNKVKNIELSNEDIWVEDVTGKPYVHTNHYLSPKMSTEDQLYGKWKESSYARYQRATEIVRPNMSKEDMVKLLSDTKNPEHPICSQSVTIGSLVFLPNQKEVWICYGHPCAGEFTKYSI